MVLQKSMQNQLVLHLSISHSCQKDKLIFCSDRISERNQP